MSCPFHLLIVCSGLAFVSGLGFGGAYSELLLDTGPGYFAVQAEAIDGDTVRLEVVAHIDNTDAPELDGRCAEERSLAVRSRDRLAELLRHGPTRAKVVGEDHFGRILVRVVSNDRPSAEMMISENLAVRSTGRAPWCPGEESSSQPVARMLAKFGH
jgi:endonuclease YncB( thermonuclease family)